eukprot:6839136-Pyramimonas_sp.AAC.1
MVGDGNMMDGHAKLHPRMLSAWPSGRIGRAVRTAEAQDVCFWTRGVCADIVPARRLGRWHRLAAEGWGG